MRIVDYCLSILRRRDIGRQADIDALPRTQAIEILRRAYAGIHDMVVIYSATGEALYANDRALAVLGLRDLGEHPIFRTGLIVHDLAGNRIEQPDWPIFRALRGDDVVDANLIVRIPHFPEGEAVRHARVSAIRTTFDGLSREPMVFVSISDTTHYIETQQRLRDSEASARRDEALLSAVMDALPTAVTACDTDGRVLRANAAARELWETLDDACEDARTVTLTGVSPETGEAVEGTDWPLIGAMRHGARIVGKRIDVRARDGAWRNLSFSAAPVRDEAGAIMGGVVACEDVSDLVQARQTVDDQENRLRLLIDGARDHAFFMLDRDGRVATWSMAAKRLKQYDEADVIGQPWSIFFTEDDAAGGLPDKLLATARAAGTAYHQGWRRRRDGSYFWADAAISAIFEQGVHVGFAEVARDLTEQRQSESDLRLRDEALRAVSQGILVVDARDAAQPIILVSGGFEALTGYRADEVIGRNCRFLQGARTSADDIRRIRDAIVAKQPCSVEILNYRADGSTFWNALSISPILDEHGEVEKFIGVMADVTERRDLEDRLRQSLKMDALGRLAGGVAHDFNNILTIINGNVEELRDDWPVGSVLRDRLDLIGKAGSRAELLTNQLLTFAKRSCVSAAAVDPAEVVANMRSLFTTLIDERAEFDVRMADGLHAIAIDRSQLEQVLLNIVINARDALGDGGQISLALENAPSRLRVGGGSRDGVSIRVSDTGIGMSPEASARAFEPFFTTKGENGSGLGLATVFGIVTQAGGTIDLESEPGIGTQVEIILPASDSTPSTEVQPAAPASTVFMDELVVVLAEDDDDVRLLITRTLQRANMRVHAFANGLEASNFIRNDAGPIDLLITDVIMPSIGGVSLSEVARKHYPDIKTLFVTGYSHRPIALKESMQLLEKPFTGRKLVASIKRLMTLKPSPAPRENTPSA
ncbi:PAS domain S-box protein [Sphingomonas sp. RHCKR47]|uniref:PAS domain S-box protein n=1 Tax=Sphingomonas citricola TaxID=2862498 RepID=UPI001CA4AEC4|nr:PAS domain S-box protein [Sphingomonas citricola]MBW6524879.1 PAS domain S-box protein [Sphingomonas citricola]